MDVTLLLTPMIGVISHNGAVIDIENMVTRARLCLTQDYMAPGI